MRDTTWVGKCHGYRQALKGDAEAAGLKATIEASSGNLLIVKEADPGCENAPTVCLQGHCDMVCSKRATTEHDFKDPIRPRLEMTDGKLCMYANGTTLRADNGIGVSAALAIACDKTLKTEPYRGPRHYRRGDYNARREAHGDGPSRSQVLAESGL